MISKMLIKVFILAAILYFLTIIQDSFLPHFLIFGYTPNLVFILIIFLIFFKPGLLAGQAGGRHDAASVSLISAILGGIFLDIFSANFFGFNVLILLAIVFFIDFILRKHVQIPLR